MADNDLKDLDAFAAEDEQLALEYRGKTYLVDPVNARTGLRIERIMAAAERAQRDAATDADAAQVLSDAEELDLYPDLLGSVYEELLDDGVPFVRLRLAATAVMLWTVQDAEIGLMYWKSGGKVQPPNREQRRAKTTRTAEVNSTKAPASGNGTNTPAKRNGKPRKAGA